MRTRDCLTLLAVATLSAACGPGEVGDAADAPPADPASNTGSDTHPEWAPDGRRIAFISNREGVRTGKPINFEVYVAAPDGAGAERRTMNDAFEAELAWSPDGAALLFKSFRDGNDEIYLLDLTTGTERNLTKNAASDGSPDWSPDGRTIAFDSDRDGTRRMYLMDADGSRVRPFPVDPGPGSGPQWSPDGSRIAFTSSRDGNDEVYVMRADGSAVHRVTNDPRANWYPRWRPDGAAIIHTTGSMETDRWSLILTDADGSNARVVVDSVDSGNATWSPDGQRLLFGRYTTYGDGGGDESRLFTFTFADSTTVRLVESVSPGR